MGIIMYWTFKESLSDCAAQFWLDGGTHQECLLNLKALKIKCIIFREKMWKRKKLKCKTITNNFIPLLHLFPLCLFSLYDMFQIFF